MYQVYFILKKTDTEELLLLTCNIKDMLNKLKQYKVNIFISSTSSFNEYLSNRMTLKVNYNLISFHQGD